MTRQAVRLGIYIGAGFGVVAAFGALLLAGNSLPLALEVVLAVAAGATSAAVLHRALQVGGAHLVTYLAPSAAGAPPAPGPPAPAAGNARLRAGTAAGAAVGLLTGVVYTVRLAFLLGGGALRDQIVAQLRQQQIAMPAGSADTLIAVGAGCGVLLYLLLIPAIAAGFGLIGAWLYGLVRPAGAPLPAPPAGP